MQQEGFFKTPDGTSLYWNSEGPENPRFVLWMVHGMGEHSGRYQNLRKAFISRGGLCVGFDLRGHGKSSGKRGHALSLDQLCGDIQALYEHKQKDFGGLPLLGFGHSLGGQLILHWQLNHGGALNAIMVSAPYLALAFEPPAWKVALGKWAARVWPSFSQATGLETAALCKDQKVVEAYKRDPLVHDKISASMFLSIHLGGASLLEKASSVQLPLLLGHGTADRITSEAASRDFAARCKAAEYWTMEGGFHELHHEPEQQIWFDRLLVFTENQLGNPAH